MTSDYTEEFDDALIQKFEQDWMQGKADEISAYLPPAQDPNFCSTLEELARIDLEFHWKTYHKDPERAIQPRPVEDYIAAHPELETVKLGLIKDEFELANRYGTAPSAQEYAHRFGEVVDGVDLRNVLRSIASEASESGNGKAEVVKPGTTLGHYEIIHEYGRGSFGAVWRAADARFGRQIAVKQLGQRLATDAEMRRQFISEARVTANLEHPGIVPVYDISDDDGSHAYYTMRLIQGQTMAEAIDQLHSIDSRSSEYELLRQRLLQAFVDACQTILYAHSQGVIHRDIKPQNMIVGKYGETILLDWGLASIIDVQHEAEKAQKVSVKAPLSYDQQILSPAESIQQLRGSVTGTPAYMPPEQARGDFAAIDQCSDVYSLGATLYHIITGVVPFTNGPLDNLLERVKAGDIPMAHETNARAEPALSSIAAKAMEVAPKDRYQSVDGLLTDVQRFLADQPVSAYRDSLVAQAARWIRKNPTAAASTAMSALFLIIATAAGLIINNSFRSREQMRVRDLEIAAERAEATALSQIQSSRFESAANMLMRAEELVQDEPLLEPLASRLAVRRDRTKRIVDFYRFSGQAQEETFFSRVSRSSVYCQAALDQLNVLTNPDWWTALPDDDLTPAQQDQLTKEVYRIICLLASMRLAETSNTMADFSMLVNPKKLDPDDPVLRMFHACGYAAERASRFRSSRGMKLIEELDEFARGQRKMIDLVGLAPLNSIDSAVMGSIMDNNVPASGPVRMAISAFLDLRDPNVVARQWLNDALKDNPDWFWLPMFMGLNLSNTGEPEAAVKVITHAVGIRPDYWVGYQYRAWASTRAALQKDLDPKRKETFLASARRDIQRAMDIEKDNSTLFWIQAIVLIQSEATPGEIRQAMTNALALHPKHSDLNEGHYSAVSQTFYAFVREFVASQADADSLSSQFRFLDAAGLLWQGKNAEAIEVCDQGLANSADDVDLQALRQLAILDQQIDPDAEPISYPPTHPLALQFALANAKLYRAQGHKDKELAELLAAERVAMSTWQKSVVKLSRARHYVESNQASMALPLIDSAIEIDHASDLSKLYESAKQNSATDVVARCKQFMDYIAPRMPDPNHPNVIVQPALMNGDFELGLSYYWGRYETDTETATWNNVGRSRTTVEGVSENTKQGQRSLAIRIESPIEEDSFGIMTQDLPVTADQQYEISFWARGDELSQDSSRVGMIDPSNLENAEFVTLPAGSYDWQKFTLSVKAASNSLPVSIWCQGSGSLYIDDIRITARTNDEEIRSLATVAK